MRNLRRDAAKTAALTVVMSGCGAWSTGRCVSAFYAQTGRTSWAGIALCCVLYGFFMGGIVRLKRSTGAGSLPEMYVSLLGRKAGAAFTALHAAFYAVCGYVLVNAAANVSEMLIPMHRAGIIGACGAVISAFFISRSKVAMKNCGCICFFALSALILALAAYGKMPGRETLNFFVKLKLESNICASVLLAAGHACLACGVGASAAVKLYPANIRPCFAGFISAAAMGGILITGNAVFGIFPPEINALKYPFAALSGAWGSAGYHFCLLVRLAETVVSLCGIFSVFPEYGMREKRRKSMLNYIFNGKIY